MATNCTTNGIDMGADVNIPQRCIIIASEAAPSVTRSPIRALRHTASISASYNWRETPRPKTEAPPEAKLAEGEIRCNAGGTLAGL